MPLPNNRPEPLTCLLRGLGHLPEELRGGAVAIGNFDGLHLGHRAVIDRLTAEAQRQAIPALVMRFYPHPRRVFTPHQGPHALQRLRQQRALLSDWGVDALCMLHFNNQLMQLSADAFVEEILVRQLAVRHVVIGDDFHFGYRRGGDAALLHRLGATHGFTAETVSAIEQDGLRASSSTIRKCLATGEIEAANRMLGRPHSIAGYVAQGQQQGRRLNTPTANIELPGLQVPRYGVYLARARWEGKEAPAVVNIGERPTVEQVKPRLEAHLLNFDGDLYGRWMEVELLQFLRPEQKFPSLSALQAQIEADKQQATRWWKERS